MIKPILIIIGIFLLASCSGYQLMFNNQPIYSPPKNYNDFSVEDSALQDCLSQTIVDQKINEVRDLRYLNCSYAGIKSLSGLTHFKWLETLNLSNNKIKDIKPLMFLGKLQKVNLKGNNSLSCNDLAVLEKLTPDQLLAPENCID